MILKKLIQLEQLEEYMTQSLHNLFYIKKDFLLLQQLIVGTKIEIINYFQRL